MVPFDVSLRVSLAVLTAVSYALDYSCLFSVFGILTCWRFGSFYSDKNGREPDYLVSENNLAFEDKRGEQKLAGSFKPFETVSEPLPAVYFGFTYKLVKGPLSLFIKLGETFVDQGSPVKFKWQYLATAGKENPGEGEWKELQVLDDDTGGLAKSGILEFFVPGAVVPDFTKYPY